MSLKISCYVCGEELKKPGALLFSPPDKDGKCDKYHFCLKCFKALVEYFFL